MDTEQFETSPALDEAIETPTPEEAFIQACAEAQDTATEPEQPAAKPEVPAKERIVKLLGEMGPHKAHLLAIMDYCREERTSAQIDEMLAPLQEFRRSIYTPVTMRALLERAGGLTFISHDEAPEEQTDENGDLVMPEKPEPTWLSTADALEVVESQDPFAELVQGLEPYAEVADVFAMVIEFCSQEERSISQIEHAVAETGRLDGSKYETGFFVGKLEDVGAIEWRGAWVATDLGMQYLALAEQA